MKNYIIVLLCILISTATINGQSKKELEAQVGQLQSELDSTKANLSSLTAVHDSTTKVLDTYIGMYKTIQEKVLPYDFKPEDIGGIIHSLQTTRDSSFASIMSGSESLRDTISIMSASIESLTSEVETLKAEIEKYKNPTAGISDGQVAALEKIKKLLDSGILTQEEFDARKKQILGNE
jgi:chromosome segregation ATPase